MVTRPGSDENNKRLTQEEAEYAANLKVQKQCDKNYDKKKKIN